MSALCIKMTYVLYSVCRIAIMYIEHNSVTSCLTYSSSFYNILRPVDLSYQLKSMQCTRLVELESENSYINYFPNIGNDTFYDIDL